MELFNHQKSLTSQVIVLDVDETLVHTMESMNKYSDMKIFTDRKSLPYRGRIYKFQLEDFIDVGSGKRDSYWGITRPHLKDFLIFCFNHFKFVIIWSAGKRTYVENIVDFMFNGLQRPHLIFAYENCTIVDGERTKPLSELTKIFGNELNLSNTWILDDKIENFIANRKNGILIPEYIPKETHSDLVRDDQTFAILMKWFRKKEVAECTDIRDLDTSKIFRIL